MTVQPDLCQTCSETTLLVFPRGGSFHVLVCATQKIKIDVIKNYNFSVCFCVYCTRGDEGHITRDDMYALMRQALIHVSMLHIIYEVFTFNKLDNCEF